MTAQPYASSSYGVLQLLLESWINPNYGALLRNVIDPSKESIVNILSDYKRGFALGAIRHQSEYIREKTAGGVCNPCTTKEWVDLWTGIIRKYNPDGDGYKDGKIA